MPFVKLNGAAAALYSLLLAGSAFAQPADPVASRRAALHSLPVVCASEYQRLCPHRTAGPAGAGEHLICLKDHTVDVSLSCRHAIQGARGGATGAATP